MGSTKQVLTGEKNGGDFIDGKTYHKKISPNHVVFGKGGSKKSAKKGSHKKRHSRKV